MSRLSEHGGPERTDVVIVGAGFAGLSAAHALRAAGIDVLVLEARERVGGRVEAIVNGLGESVDSGGQFLCEDMPELMALVQARGLTLKESHLAGRFVALPPVSDVEAHRNYAAATAIRDRLNELSPDAPSLAGLTVADWLALQSDDADAKAGFRSMIEGLWCLALERMPAWYLVSNDRRVTNTVGELQYYVGETMHALAERLAQDLGDAVVLGAAASRIERRHDGVRVFANVAAPPPLSPPHKGEGDSIATPPRTFTSDIVRNGGATVALPLMGRGQGWGYAADRLTVATIDARAVLVAVPPMMASHIALTPPLPAPLRHALTVWESGAVIKVQLRYRTAFWRERGLSGMVMWREPPGLFAFDTSPDGERPMLTFFIGGPKALAMTELDPAALREAAITHLIEGLGSPAAEPIDVTVRDWTHDRWSGGAYSDVVIDLDATDAEDVLRAGAPPVFFASSELSPSYPGYIEGAIVAGRSAAARVIASLKPQSASATKASGS
ncbi:FAD-dependent oxidoreductase [Mesorhizobium sp. CN5-321]|uniref:flavin monoamine oxidase family protein n=1 Tax=Mesorhizobium hunchu TaxID=3157708 RepID=UPI0032B87A4B